MPTSCSDCGLRDKWSVATGNFRAQPKVNCPRSVTDGLRRRREPLQLSGSSKTTVTEAMLRKAHCCSWQSTDRAQFSSTTKQNNTPHFSSHLDNTVQGRHFHKEQGTEMDVKHRFLHYRNKQTYLSLAKMCCFESYSEWQICVWAYL